MNALDRSLFWWINGLPSDQAPFWVFLSKGTDQGAVRIALILVIVGLLIPRSTRRGAIVSATAWIFANLWTDLLKAAIPFKRPAIELLNVDTHGVGVGSVMGTASAHSANMMCVAVCFAWYFRWWSIPWFVLAALVGISRSYVGAHYPSQVVLGWIVGAVTALVICRTVDSAFTVWKRDRSQANPDPEPGSGDLRV